MRVAEAPPDLEHEYNVRLLHADRQQFYDRYRARSEAAYRDLEVVRDIRYGTGSLWRMPVQIGAQPVLVRAEETTWRARPDWSRDGRRIVYSSYLGRQWHQLWLATAEGDAGGDPFPLTYGEYADLATRAASGMRALGVAPGDRVVLMMRNTPEFHVLDMAAVLCGATPVSIYNSSSVDQVAYLVDHGLAAIVAPGHDRQDASTAARLELSRRELDAALMFARMRRLLSR